MPNPVDAQPHFLEHVFGFVRAAHLRGKKAVKLGAEKIDQGRSRTRVRMLIQRHQILCRVSARHQGAEVGLDRIRLHGVLLQMIRCHKPNSYGDSVFSITPLLAAARLDRRRRVP
jgi:hypothetical protein